MMYDLRENSNQECLYFRNSRYLAKIDGWYFQTRERGDIGPFFSKEEAQKGVKSYVSNLLKESYVLLEQIISERSQKGCCRKIS